MKLSAETFAELAASFNATVSPTQHERRRAARMDLAARIRIRPAISDQKLESMHVTVSNFSARGLSFVHNTKMESGRQFITELPRNGGGSVELLCTVVHSVQMGVNTYRIGAEFTCVLPAASRQQDDQDEMKRISKSMMK